MDAETFMYCRGWSEAKPGHTDDENQDAFEIRLVPDAAGGSMLLAVCDGASSAVYAEQWARALAAAAEPDWTSLDDDTLTATLDQVREQFQLTLPADLPWYMSHKMAREGSQATLLVASFRRIPGRGEISCRAVAVGDSSLLLFRGDGSTVAFPVGKSADFGLSPRLVSTKAQPGLPYERWDAILGPGDVVIGCTDAVAKWMLEGVESADRPSLFRVLLDILGDGGDPEQNMGPAGQGLSGRITGDGAPRRLEEDDLTLVLGVPVPPESARAPLPFARQVLGEHPAGDFGRPAPPPSSWTTVLNGLRRVVRAVVQGLRVGWRWMVNALSGTGRRRG